MHEDGDYFTILLSEKKQDAELVHVVTIFVKGEEIQLYIYLYIYSWGCVCMYKCNVCRLYMHRMSLEIYTHMKTDNMTHFQIGELGG